MKQEKPKGDIEMSATCVANGPGEGATLSSDIAIVLGEGITIIGAEVLVNGEPSANPPEPDGGNPAPGEGGTYRYTWSELADCGASYTLQTVFELQSEERSGDYSVTCPSC